MSAFILRNVVAGSMLLGLLAGCAEGPTSPKKMAQPFGWSHLKVPQEAPADSIAEGVVIVFGGNALHAVSAHHSSSFKLGEVPAPNTIHWSRPSGIFGRGSDTGFYVHFFDNPGQPCWSSITWFMARPGQPAAPVEASPNEGPGTNQVAWPHC